MSEVDPIQRIPSAAFRIERPTGGDSSSRQSHGGEPDKVELHEESTEDLVEETFEVPEGKGESGLDIAC